MKILMAIKRLEAMAGGAEKIFLQVAQGLKNHGHTLEIISFDAETAESFYPLPNSVPWFKVPIGDSSKPASFLETLRRIFALRAYLKKSKPDIIIAFQSSMMVPVAFSFPGLPIIASEHIVPAHYKKRRFHYPIYHAAALLCRKITVVSEPVRLLFTPVLQKRMVVIPNPVSPCPVKADTAGQAGERKMILSVGRLEPQKDHETLIRAFSRLAGVHPDWDLIIRGEGAERGNLERLVSELGLQTRVSLPGLTKSLAQDYAAVHIFALASIYESFGLATVEAMSAGLPVVGFADCPGTNNVIRDRANGLLVQVVDGEDRDNALAAALSPLMSDTALRVAYGNTGIKDAEAYNLESIIQKWALLVDSI